MLTGPGEALPSSLGGFGYPVETLKLHPACWIPLWDHTEHTRMSAGLWKGEPACVSMPLRLWDDNTQEAVRMCKQSGIGLWSLHNMVIWDHSD